jgi:hypothetical protein
MMMYSSEHHLPLSSDVKNHYGKARAARFYAELPVQSVLLQAWMYCGCLLPCWRVRLLLLTVCCCMHGALGMHGTREVQLWRSVTEP